MMQNVQKNGTKRRAGSGWLDSPRSTTAGEGIIEALLRCRANYGADQAFEV
jgi:hypothetical protein